MPSLAKALTRLIVAISALTVITLTPAPAAGQTGCQFYGYCIGDGCNFPFPTYFVEPYSYYYMCGFNPEWECDGDYNGCCMFA